MSKTEGEAFENAGVREGDDDEVQVLIDGCDRWLLAGGKVVCYTKEIIKGCTAPAMKLCQKGTAERLYPSRERCRFSSGTIRLYYYLHSRLGYVCDQNFSQISSSLDLISFWCGAVVTNVWFMLVMAFIEIAFFGALTLAPCQ